MILHYGDVISTEEHAELLEVARAATFVDGRETAGVRLAEVKHNEQIARNAPALGKVGKLVGAALQRNQKFLSDVLPRHMHSLRLSRYGVGMHYGQHIDAAIMHDGPLLARADLSFTLFLSEPDSYDGGELCIDTGSGEMRFKLPPRCMICYPTGQLHQVREVTRGERLAVVGWVHCCVRDPINREVLCDLKSALDLVYEAQGKCVAHDLLVKSHTNLLRRWAEP